MGYGRSMAAAAGMLVASTASIVGYVVAIAIALIFAWACATIAARKGRRVVLWGILGFILPLIALIVILVLPPSSHS